MNRRFLYLFLFVAINSMSLGNANFSHTYKYDSLGNRLEKDGNQCQVNELCQITSDSNCSYEYDLDGNLINDGECRYSYDSLERLTGIQKGDLEIKYAYDPFNRRLSKEILKKGKKIDKVLFMWDGDNEIGCTDENGVILQLRVLGEGLGNSEIGAAVLIEINGRPYIPIHDHRGCVVVLVDVQTRQPVETYRYTAFGEELVDAQLCPWRFASKRVDAETGLVYFGRRHYSPPLGRWITPDPQGFGDGPNLYAYLHNCPLNDFDPYGLWGWMSMWDGAKSFGRGASKYLYDMGCGTGYGLGKLGEWMHADFQYEHFNDPSFFRSKSLAATEGWKSLGRSAYNDPMGTLASGLMEAWRMPSNASFSAKAEAWSKGVVDIGLAATTLWKGAQMASSIGKLNRIAAHGGRLGEATSLLGKAEIGSVERMAGNISSSHGFLGHRNWELKHPKYQDHARNITSNISGRQYSGHALDQMQNRGILPTVVENAIQNGKVYSTRSGTIGYYDSSNNIRVIVNSHNGHVITTIPGAP